MAGRPVIARRLGRLLGLATDRALNQLWPLEAHTRAYLATLRVTEQAADDLADAEAAVEVTEPPLEPWEQELRDACALDDCYQPDDLWAAEQRAGTITDLPTDQTIDEWMRSLNLPADRDNGVADLPSAAPSQHTVDVGRPDGAVVTTPASASGAVGTPTPNDVATVIAVILRRHGINSAPIYADLAARELAQHFTFHRK